jgi:hypothetical protein
VQVSSLGSLVFYDGVQRVLPLQRGRIKGHGFVSFPRAWAEGRFVENRELAGDALLDPTLTPEQENLLVRLALQLQRRALTRIRTSGHGALVVLMPTNRAATLTAAGGVLRPKYRRLPGGAGPRFASQA